MTTVNLGKEFYKEVKEYWMKQDKLKYPTFNNFIRQKLKEVIK